MLELFTIFFTIGIMAQNDCDNLTEKIDSLKNKKHEYESQLTNIVKGIDSLQILKRECVAIKKGNGSAILAISRISDYAYKSPNGLVSDTVYAIQKNESVEIIDALDKYYLVRKNGQVGYVRRVDFDVPDSCISSLNNFLIKKGLMKPPKAYGLLRISDLKVSEPNSAGGVDVTIDLYNCSGKTIKYIDLYLNAFNAVGDKVQCSITRKNSNVLRITGPINLNSIDDIKNNNHTFSYSWANVWYNATISCIKTSSIVICFTDNTTRTISKQFNKIFDDNISNDCSYNE